jgi:site-specific DNA-methyltransferase (adenine-specific)
VANEGLLNAVHNTDLLTLCAQIEPASVDLICADLPYGVTSCAWDSVIPFEPMWAAFKRIVKPRAAIVLTASQPFTSALVMSNPKWFKYSWYWQKERATGFNYAAFQPMRIIEDVCVFGNGPVPYYPQLVKLDKPYRAPYPIIKSDSARMTSSGLNPDGTRIYKTYTHSQPQNLIRFVRDFNTKHPTEKPIALFRYLIRTYTRPGDLVVDPCVGSGTTALAARAEGRRYIVGDSSAEYCEVARKRLDAPYTLPMLGLFAEEGAS